MNTFDQTTQTAIIDAIIEARILEYGRAQYEETNILKVAAHLANRPIDDVQLIYTSMQEDTRPNHHLTAL